MHIKPFKACLPELEKISDAADFFGNAKFTFADFRKQAQLTSTSAENFYVYRITTGKKFSTGLIACADVEDYLKGNIKKHEDTIVSNEEKHTALMREHNAVIKPILLMHDVVDALAGLYDKIIKTQSSILDINLKETRHQLWAVTNFEDAREIKSLFDEKISTTYIADGHHRAASIATLYRENKNVPMLCAFFSSDDLIIKPFHRIVTDVNGLTFEELIKKLSNHFEINYLPKKTTIPEKVFPRKKNEFILFFEKKVWELNFKKEILIFDPENFKNKSNQESGQETRKNFLKERNSITDAKIFNDKILNDVFGIEDVRNSDKIKYIEGNEPTGKILAECPKQNALFLLYPISIKDFKNIVDTAGVLPPKSTFFEPRLLNGLINCEL